MNSSTIFAPSELVLNEAGRIYHLDLYPEEIADTIITVGDPDRVSKISSYFDHIEVQRSHRGYVTHTGTLQGKRLSVVSTGIGVGSAEIALIELDALANIDFSTRTIKEKKTSLSFLRLGTAGALFDNSEEENFCVASHAIGLDNLLFFYQRIVSEEEKTLLRSIEPCFTDIASFLKPYVVSADQPWRQYFSSLGKVGVALTCPGFFGPQGRALRATVTIPDLITRLQHCVLSPYPLLKCEMETSALYGLSAVLGHRACSLSVLVTKRVTKKIPMHWQSAMTTLIEKSLALLCKI